MQSGSFNIKLKKINEGFFYFRGIETTEITSEKNSASISVNGKSVLGLFKNPVGENAFVYVSEKNASEIHATEINSVVTNLIEETSQITNNDKE